jgi:PhnB protein
MVKPIPDGYHSATPYLIIRDAAKALDFYKAAFKAVEIFRMDGPDGKVGHAEVRIGDSMLMLADEHPAMGYTSPQALGGTPVSIMLYVEDCDSVFNRAIEAGGKVKEAITDKFYGDRSGSLTDPFGHVWHVATHKEDVSPQELQRRLKEMLETGQPSNSKTT